MPPTTSHTPTMINISKSSLTWQLPHYPNQDRTTLGRFMLESRLQFIPNTKSGLENDWWLLAPVMACKVFGEMPVFQQPAYEYWAIFGDTHYHVMRTGDDKRITDSTHAITDTFNWVHRHRVESTAQGLTSTPAIIQATLAHHPLMAQAVIPSPEYDGHWVMTFPIKHINVCADTMQFQCETGPVLLPQQDAPLDPTDVPLEGVDTFFRKGVSLAYVAFNQLDQLESIVRIRHGDGTRRYRERWLRPADITIWALGV